MFARMLVHENAGVAGYSEAFMYGQSGKQASIGSSYLITDVLVSKMAVGSIFLLFKKVQPTRYVAPGAKYFN